MDVVIDQETIKDATKKVLNEVKNYKERKRARKERKRKKKLRKHNKKKAKK